MMIQAEKTFYLSHWVPEVGERQNKVYEDMCAKRALIGDLQRQIAQAEAELKTLDDRWGDLQAVKEALEKRPERKPEEFKTVFSMKFNGETANQAANAVKRQAGRAAKRNR